MLGLVHEGEGVAARALESFGIGHEAVRQRVEETIGPVEAFGGAAVGLLEGLGINPKSARPVGVAQPGGDDANVSPFRPPWSPKGAQIGDRHGPATLITTSGDVDR